MDDAGSLCNKISNVYVPHNLLNSFKFIFPATTVSSQFVSRNTESNAQSRLTG